MSYKERLKGLEKRGMDFGVERTRNILDKLGAPDKKLKIIHIAGTNGKGSVAEYLTQILIADGKSVGTFTSPAVYDYLEQFRIDGENISEDLFEKAFNAAFKNADGATEFEVETAAAIYAFALAGCEYAVIECGLGGQYDATNAVSNKEIAVITSISLEHTNVLGSTLREICEHKAGIIKDCTAVVSAFQSEEVLEYFSKKSVIFAGEPQNVQENGFNGYSFLYGGNEFEISMIGCLQPYNTATAIEAARRLKISQNAIYSGVKRAKLLGRLEVLNAGGRTYILDGAHNPASFVPLCEFLGRLGGADTVVLGSLSDKDINRNIHALKPYVKKIFAVTPQSARAMGADKVAATCIQNGIPSKIFNGTSEALEEADGLTCVCGTFTILKEAKLWIKAKQ